MRRTIFILSVLIIETTSFACECGHGTFLDEVASSAQIFIGTVFKKTSAEKVYYSFSISQMFKGEKIDTLVITTGFGGPDCGMIFEIGKTYLVYSNNDATDRCGRNFLADKSSDIGKLKYLFQSDFSRDVGKTSNSILSLSEAEYFNSELAASRRDFNFQNKNIAFFLNGSVIDKQQYFDKWGGKDVSTQLVTLTQEEKLKVKGYDAIIISWRKHGVSKSFRKRLIKKLT